MVKNILFDFGGVLYDIDFKRTFDAFEELGFSDFENMFSQHNANALFQDLETGHLTPDAFYKRIQALAPQPVTEEQIRTAWNALLIAYRTRSLEHLLYLSNDYQLFLLSNTNPIHYDHFARQLQEQTQYPTLESFFTKAYYSQQIGCRKPNLEAFEYVLKDAGIDPQETLFIDDSYTNLPTAAQLGMKTHLLLPGQFIENLDYKNFLQWQKPSFPFSL